MADGSKAGPALHDECVPKAPRELAKSPPSEALLRYGRNNPNNDDLRHEYHFSPEWLRETLSSDILKGSYKLPNKSDLAALCNDLNNVRHLVRMKKGPWQRMTARRLALRQAVNQMERQIPHLLREVRGERAASQSGFIDDNTCEKNFTALQSLQRALRELKECPDLFGPGPAEGVPVEHWQYVALNVAALFRTAMKASNPTVVLGNSDGGPVSRFVSAVLPHITSESVKAGTVAAFLKAKARQ